MAVSSSLLYNLGLVLLLVTGALVGNYAYQVWKEVNENEEPAKMEELMETFEQARAAGELDDAEFARVRRRLEALGPCQPETPHSSEDAAGRSERS